jgi:hypothetical protein
MGNMSSKAGEALKARQLAFGWALLGWVTQRRARGVLSKGQGRKGMSKALFSQGFHKKSRAVTA